MEIITIKGKKYIYHAVSDSVPELIVAFQKFMDWKETPYVDVSGRIHRSDGKDVAVGVMKRGKKYYAVGIDYKKSSNLKNTSIMKKQTKKSAKRGNRTLKEASRIYQSQKNDYKRIFKSEIGKGGDSKKAAKRAGEAYRAKYGATPKARWNNARKTAKRFVNA